MQKIHGVGSLGIGSDAQGVTKFYPCVGLPQKEIIKIEEDYKRIGINNTFILYSDGSLFVAGGTDYYVDRTTTFKEIDIKNMLSSKVIDIAEDRFRYALLLTENNKVYKLWKNAGILKADEITGLPEIEEIHTYMNHQPAILKAKNGDFYYYNYLDPKNNRDALGLIKEKTYENSETKTYKTLIKVNDCIDPKVFTGDDTLKEIIYSNYAYFYFMSSGKIWASGDLVSMGLGKDYISNSESSSMGDITLVFDPNRSDNLFKGIANSKIIGTKNDIFTYNIDMTGITPLITENGKVYITNNKELMYGDSILVGYWKKIASDCKKIFVGGTNKIGFINSNGEAFVAVSDLRDVGVKSIDSSVLSGTNNFHKVTAISEKIDSLGFGEGAFFVLAEDGKFYSAGRNRYDTSWAKNAHLGYADGEAIDCLKVLDTDVKYFFTDTSSKGSVVYNKNDETLKCFGAIGDKGIVNATSYDQLFFTPTDAIYLNNNKNDLKKIIMDEPMSLTLLKTGNVLIGGMTTAHFTSIKNKVATEYTWQNLGLDGKIIDLVIDWNNELIIFLTENNNLFGAGMKNMLGIGNGSSDIQGNFIKLGLSNIVSICNNAQGIFAVDKDGKVFGTGLNTYGILGRWVGIDRRSPNSRYKTAIDWVECPDLEI